MFCEWKNFDYICEWLEEWFLGAMQAPVVSQQQQQHFIVQKTWKKRKNCACNFLVLVCEG